MEPTRRLAVVWFADVVGFTSLAARDEEAAIALAGLLQESARRQVGERGGTIVKFVGDGLLAYAPGVATAIDTVLALRQDFSGAATAIGQPSHLRIGVHLGDVVMLPDGDIIGDGVNVASRLQAEAEPGTIYVSDDIWRLCKQRSDVRFASIGPRQLKGLASPLWIHELEPPAQAISPEGGVRGPATSIAVLPFDVLGSGDEARYLASGLHNDLLTELAKIPALTVISRTSVMGYQGTTKALPLIGRELNAATIIEGAVQASGTRVRLTIQLIDATTDTHQWADYFDRELTTEGLFEIQTELTTRILDSLKDHLGPAGIRPRAGPATRSMEAYRLVVEGRMQFDRKTEQGLTKAIELFGAAVRVDSAYGLAWVGLADALAITADYGYGEREQLVARAQEAADRAIAILPDAAEPHCSLGLIAEASQDAPLAIREYESAIRLEPGHADAHSWHAWVSFLIGKSEQALRSASRSVELNPLSAEAVTNLALAHLTLAEPQQALAEAKRASNISPGYTTAAYYEGLSLYDLGRFKEAVEALIPLGVTVAGELSTPWAGMGPDAALGLSQHAAGFTEDALQTLAVIEDQGYAFEAGLVRLGVGAVPQALADFRRVKKVGYGPALLFHHHFRLVWDAIRTTDEYRDLKQLVGASWGVKPAL